MRRLLLLTLLLTRIAHADVAGAIDEYFTRLTAHGFSGAVLVARGNEILLRKGYGSTDRSSGGAPNRPDTAFNIASLDKQFIAAGILRLEELGKLQTTDTLDRFFANLPDEKKSITLHHVLTHTAGFPDEYWDSYETLTRAQFLEKILAGKKLTAPPGTRMSYASFDYWLLEEVIERVAGMPFEQFLRREFFDPLGMQLTGFALPKWDRANIARSTLWTVPSEALEGEGKYADPIARPAAWRVMASTADDLYKWYLALRDGKVLTPASRKKLFTPGLDRYGYGWYIVPTARGTTLIQHGGGGSFGSVATFRWFRDEDWFFTILNNSITGFQSDYNSADVEALLFSGACMMPPPFAALDEAAAVSVTGRYRLPDGGTIEVTRPKNGPLVALTRDADGIIALTLGGVEGGSLPPDRTVHEMIDGWSRGNFAPPPQWREDGWTSEALADWAKSVWTSSAERLGAFRAATTMHYRSFIYQGNPELLSFIDLRFDKGDVLLRVIHEVSGRVALNAVRQQPGAEAVLAPSPRGGYTAWEPRLGSTVRIDFTGKGDARAMRLTGGAGTVVATRAGGE
jgi:CubicO group peptidase (beta-lactamase class C family)